MDKYQVVETRKHHSTNPANASGFDTFVVFSNEAHRIDTVTVDGWPATPEQISAAIKAHVAERDKHAGTTIEA